jgi:hypothetical protein
VQKGKRAHGSIETERAEQPPVRRAIAEGDAAAFAFATLPAPERPTVGAEGGPCTTEKPSGGAAAPTPELRRGGGGGARVEGRDGVGDAEEVWGGGRGVGKGGGASGHTERGLEAVDDGGGDLQQRREPGRGACSEFRSLQAVLDIRDRLGFYSNRF